MESHLMIWNHEMELATDPTSSLPFTLNLSSQLWADPTLPIFGLFPFPPITQPKKPNSTNIHQQQYNNNTPTIPHLCTSIFLQRRIRPMPDKIPAEITLQTQKFRPTILQNPYPSNPNVKPSRPLFPLFCGIQLFPHPLPLLS
ncbi:hypothetical protein H5410_038967 [Solanum commersonii]|uniref:Uncharacterized protein n=1 Tax=Solanum commersonii TaxID=4109 RepID=A0A9J5YCY4_SOLCO|nr:hypothetical protein H5410_038967 [Solanum commersonii]